MRFDRIMPDIWMVTMSKVVLCFASKVSVIGRLNSPRNLSQDFDNRATARHDRYIGVWSGGGMQHSLQSPSACYHCDETCHLHESPVLVLVLLHPSSSVDRNHWLAQGWYAVISTLQRQD